jgi:Fe2+ transport system protein FeoA
MTLDKLKPGQTATITHIEGEGPAVQRLMALGVLEGSVVKVIRTALGGDPIEVQIMDYALSLRRDEARNVQVTTGNAQSR